MAASHSYHVSCICTLLHAHHPLPVVDSLSQRRPLPPLQRSRIRSSFECHCSNPPLFLSVSSLHLPRPSRKIIARTPNTDTYPGRGGASQVLSVFAVVI